MGPALRTGRRRPPAHATAVAVRVRRSRSGCARGARRVRRPAAPGRSRGGAAAAIEEGRPPRDLFGPPGPGKTTLARIVAASANAAFEELCAVSRAAEVRDVIVRAPSTGAAGASGRCSSSTRSTASTRPSRTPCCRPSRRASSRSSGRRPRTRSSRSTARSSRAPRVYELHAPRRGSALLGALERGARGAGDPPRRGARFIADGRRRRATALSTLELAHEPSRRRGGREDEDVTAAVMRRPVRYDRDGDNHYDTISAFIKACERATPTRRSSTSR